MNRRIPYAVANYEEIVRDIYYFVDKSRFIRDIEPYKIPVFLRPLRFGWVRSGSAYAADYRLFTVKANCLTTITLPA
jgi:hypothetical protein